MSRLRVFPILLFLIIASSLSWSRSDTNKPAVSSTGTEQESPTPPGASSSYLVGTSLMKKGELQEALPYLAHAYRLGPEIREFGDAYAEALLAAGYALDALEVLGAMVTQYPRDAELLKRKIELLVEMGREQSVLENLELARRQGVYTSELALVEAGVQARLNNPDRALELAREALDGLPGESERIYFLMASILDQAGRPAELSDMWDEAAETLPGSASICFERLRHLVSSGRVEEARAEAVEADRSGRLWIEPGSDEEIVWELELVNLLLEEGQVAEVRDILTSRRAAGLVLGPEENLLLGRILGEAGDVNLLFDVMRETIARWPDDPRGHYFLGDIAAIHGDLAEAESELRTAIRLDPGRAIYRIALVRTLVMKYNAAMAATASADASIAAEIVKTSHVASALLREDEHQSHLVLGYALRRIGETRVAAEHFDMAAAGRDTREDALLNLSLCYEEIGDFSKARSFLEIARREFNDSATVANAFGYYLADRNRELELAEKMITEALEKEPENGSFIDSMGWVLYRQGKFQDAFDHLVRAVNIFPENATVLEHMGIVMIAMGRQVEGLRVLRQARDLGNKTGTLLDAIEKTEKELGLE